MNLSAVKQVYLLGIGGIGMSALARWFAARGCRIFGYDKTETSLTRELVAEGMQISYLDQVSQVHESLLQSASETLFIYTPSVPASSITRAWLASHGVPLYKRSQVLGFISKSMSVLAVAGTHGKTTTSTLLAHLLKHAGLDVTAFLGGISANYSSNLLIGSSQWVVIEADEYDRSFLTLFPAAAAITSMDADHLDIYGDVETMREAYVQFASQVQEGGLIAREGLELECRHLTYSAGEILAQPADIRAENIHIVGGAYRFDYVSKSLSLRELDLFVPGRHNVENAVAAISLAILAGVNDEALRSGLGSFQGVKRRFERLAGFELPEADLLYVDDYAHHPAELKALLTTARELFADRKICIVFQPHLFSRTRDFYREMASALSLADRAMLMDIYPAREAPLPGISSRLILDEMSIPEKAILSPEDIFRELEASQPGSKAVWLTAGAGDIDLLTTELKARIDQLNQRDHERK